jgi:hypothetical protein
VNTGATLKVARYLQLLNAARSLKVATCEHQFVKVALAANNIYLVETFAAAAGAALCRYRHDFVYRIGEQRCRVLLRVGTISNTCINKFYGFIVANWFCEFYFYRCFKLWLLYYNKNSKIF